MILRIKELSPLKGHTTTEVAVEEARDLDFKSAVTVVLPDGKQVHSFDELLEAITGREEEEVVEVMRFPPLMGG